MLLDALLLGLVVDAGVVVFLVVGATMGQTLDGVVLFQAGFDVALALVVELLVYLRGVDTLVVNTLQVMGLDGFYALLLEIGDFLAFLGLPLVLVLRRTLF